VTLHLLLLSIVLRSELSSGTLFCEYNSYTRVEPALSFDASGFRQLHLLHCRPRANTSDPI